MNKSFPKNKEKRRRSSSNESNTSFVKNVTSRVSGLLPATITKWFSSPSSSNANGSTPTAEVTDSSTEDEAPENPIVTQPPAKRMRYNTSGKFSYYGHSDVNCTTSKIEILEIPGVHYPGTQFPVNRNSVPILPIRTPNETFTNEFKEENKRDTPRFKSTQHTVSSIGASVASKRKSIFDKSCNEEPSKPTKKPTASAEKRPCFKPTLLGSPFYPGRTMYGGAAASSYLHTPNIQHQTVALVKETKTSEDSLMSTSARHIMDLLESYSSPLMEARRIPQYIKPKHESFDTPTERFAPYVNKSLSHKTQELHVPSIASVLRLKQRSRLMDCTKTARQIIASHSSASNYPLTYTPVSYPPVTSDTANTIQTTQPSQLRQETENEQNNKMTTKVKTRVTRTNRGNQEELDIATPVKLPSAILQIDQNKLPKISFTSESNLLATSTPKGVPPAPKTIETKKNNEVSTSKPDTVSSSSIFKFSNPLKISADTPDAVTPPKFIFDSPERRIEQHYDSKSDASSVVGNVNETNQSATNAKDWPCPDCWVKNNASVTKCLCCGYKKPVKAAKCSMCKLADSQAEKDKCVNCDKMVSPPSEESSQSTKWKCDGCWVMNEDNAPKCVCCGANNPMETSKSTAAIKVAESAAFPEVKLSPRLGCFTDGSQPTVNSNSKQLKLNPLATNAVAFFKSSGESDSSFVSLAKIQKSDKWECSDCLVMNESAKSVCVCCGTPKATSGSDSKQTKPPPLHSNTSSFFGTTDKGDSAFVSFARTQKSQKWECSSCLVMNETDQSVCVCCGTEKEAKNKLGQTKFNFGVNNTSFKFGIEPKVQEAAITQQPDVQASTEIKFKEQSETNNNVLAETPTFTFTLPTKKIETKIDPLKAKPEEAVKFSFGIPKDPNILANKSEPVKIPENDTEKAQEVPEVNFAAPVPEKPKIGFESFGTTVTQEKPLLPPPNLFASSTFETKIGTPSNPLTLQPAASGVEQTPLQNTFTLTGASNLFGAPTLGNSVNMFTAPPDSSANTTSTLTVAPLLPAVPPQKIETTNAAPAPAVAPMFTFGTNGVNSSVPMSATSDGDKPKFAFTFGSSNPAKTEGTPSMLGTTNAQPVMKSLFAPSVENAKTMNAFSLTSGNSLVSSNAMATNALDGSNGLPPSNGLGGNTLSINPMAGNTLSGNSLSGNLLAGNALGGNTFSTNNLTGVNSVSQTNTLMSTNGLAGNTLSSGNSLQPNNTLTNNSGSSIFGNTVQKENMWNSNNNAPSSNMFAANATTNNLQTPPTFTFGTATPFNAPSSTPAFGSNAQSAPNIFGMANQNNTLFSSPVRIQNPASMFGSPAPNNNPAPQMDMFATQNMGTAPTFGAPNPSITSFEVPSMAPAPTPTFNFGSSSQQSTGIFGFGQQQHQQQPASTAGFNFGVPQAGSPAGAPAGGVQFAMGTAPGTVPGTRKIRKARRSNIR